jgi:hypothetical protein
VTLSESAAVAARVLPMTRNVTLTDGEGIGSTLGTASTDGRVEAPRLEIVTE